MRGKASRERQEAYLQEGLNRVTQIHATSQQIIICAFCQKPNPNTNSVCVGGGNGFVPVGDLSPSSVVDPVEFAHKSKQVKNSMDIVIENYSPDS